MHIANMRTRRMARSPSRCSSWRRSGFGGRNATPHIESSPRRICASSG